MQINDTDTISGSLTQFGHNNFLINKVFKQLQANLNPAVLNAVTSFTLVGP